MIAEKSKKVCPICFSTIQFNAVIFGIKIRLKQLTNECPICLEPITTLHLINFRGKIIYKLSMKYTLLLPDSEVKCTKIVNNYLCQLPARFFGSKFKKNS